jgi:hypothetical protein
LETERAAAQKARRILTTKRSQTQDVKDAVGKSETIHDNIMMGESMGKQRKGRLRNAYGRSTSWPFVEFA